MSGLKLRPYQRECIDAVFKSWEGGMRRPAVVLPTGAGKTVVFSELIKEFWEGCWQARHPAPRVIVLVHRDELADQAIAKIRATLGDAATVGKVKSESDDVTADVMVCSVQTISRTRRMRNLLGHQTKYGAVGLIITDECHHGVADSYGRVYAAFPDALQLGVTATLARGDGQGLGDVWEDVVYERSVLWMIANNFLSDVRTRRVEVAGLDLSQVKSSRGDYQVGDLGRALEDSHAEDVITRAYVEHAKDRPGVVFTPTVPTARAAADSLNAAGIRSEVVHGETPRDRRQQIFHDYRTGAVQVLVNCMVLTEGFDAPWASCAVIARPTQSAPLYTQMVGRVLRLWPGKDDALVLDVVGASRHRLRTLVDLAPGHVLEDRDDVLLSELVEEAQEREAEEAERAGKPAPAGAISFAIKHREVDMFASSDVAWSRTPGGVLFIECGTTTVFLWPSAQEGLWTVCTVGDDGKWIRHPQYRELDLSSAMMWGEVVAEDQQSFSVQRSARWRSGKPSDAQINYATSLGIDVTGMSRGQVSEAIGLRRAARRFDRYVKSDSVRA